MKGIDIMVDPNTCGINLYNQKSAIVLDNLNRLKLSEVECDRYFLDNSFYTSIE